VTFVTRRYRFSASHRLHVSSLGAEENARLYGKCNNPYGHGHDYVLEVTCAGDVDGKTGLIVPAAQLDALVQQVVLSLLASKNINVDVPQFANRVPTTENLTTVIAELLKQNWNSFVRTEARLTRVHVQETDRNGFEVPIPAGAANEKVTADA
jgi:6-pyruvoyltetrahydropterin/6-carboxytetrahydropterin synthase